MIAKMCVPVYSSWVATVIKGCQGEFAVQFKHGVYRDQDHKVRRWWGGVPGVVCFYPTAPPVYFDLMLAAPSKGRFVHQYLDKKLPYQIIPNPCPEKDCGQQVNCCAHPVPNVLHVTLLPDVGCACVGGSFPITWNGSTWHGTGNFGCGTRAVTVDLRCAAILPGDHPDAFRLSYTMSDGCGSGTDIVPGGPPSCHPFAMGFAAGSGSGCGCPGLADTWRIQVTA